MEISSTTPIMVMVMLALSAAKAGQQKVKTRIIANRKLVIPALIFPAPPILMKLCSHRSVPQMSHRIPLLEIERFGEFDSPFPYTPFPC
jgi:hypothetical protein